MRARTKFPPARVACAKGLGTDGPISGIGMSAKRGYGRIQPVDGIGSLQMTPDRDGLAVFPDDEKTPLAQSPSQRGLGALSRISVC